MVQWHVASDHGWLGILSRPHCSREDEPGVEAIGTCVHKRRTLNTWLCSGTSAGTFTCPAGPYRNCRGEAGTKSEPKWYFVPVSKKGPKVDPTFRISLIFFSRGSSPPLNCNRNHEWWGDFSHLVKIEKMRFLGIWRYKIELRFWLDFNFEISNTKRWQIAFATTSIVHSLAPLGTKLLGRPAQSVIESQYLKGSWLF